MNKVVKIGKQSVTVREYNGQRVITFKDIDRIHIRPKGTAKRNFNTNKYRFREGKEYFRLRAREVGTEVMIQYGFSNKAQQGILITEYGYLLLMKSFTDDLAWEVQGQFLNTYFRSGDDISDLPESLQILKRGIDIKVAKYRESQRNNEIVERIRKLYENCNEWRIDTTTVLLQIGTLLGGGDYYRELRAESYKLLSKRTGANLELRLAKKRIFMSQNGISQSAINKISLLDVIADDLYLISVYIIIVIEMATEYVSRKSEVTV